MLDEHETVKDRDAIFFRRREYFVAEDAGSVRIDVLRLGKLVSLAWPSDGDGLTLTGLFVNCRRTGQQ